MASSSATGPRSLLFVPGNRCERFAAAMTSGADAVIVDLEDAVGGVLPKAERPGVVADVEDRLVAAADGTTPELVLLVETAAGVLGVCELADAPSRLVRRMCFGTYDFALDMGVVPAAAGSC